jgi:hypothetical protein
MCAHTTLIQNIAHQALEHVLPGQVGEQDRSVIRAGQVGENDGSVVWAGELFG